VITLDVLIKPHTQTEPSLDNDGFYGEGGWKIQKLPFFVISTSVETGVVARMYVGLWRERENLKKETGGWESQGELNTFKWEGRRTPIRRGTSSERERGIHFTGFSEGI